MVFLFFTKNSSKQVTLCTFFQLHANFMKYTKVNFQKDTIIQQRSSIRLCIFEL